MYADLAYYAMGNAPPSAKALRFIRERGGLQGVLRTLGADPSVQQANLDGMQAWVDSHPVDPNNADAVQARALVVAAIADARAKLNAGDVTTADAAFQRAKDQYQAFAAQQFQQEAPSAFALWLANTFNQPAEVAAKVAAGIGVAALVIGGAIVWSKTGRRA